MTRSRKRKLRRAGVSWAGMPLATTLMSAGAMVHAEGAGETGALEEIVVTAQKRTEDLQKVPISLQVLGGEKLEQLQVSNFDDYAKFLPSVSFQSTGPGQAQLYFRGIASGGDGLHSGSSSATGMYLDETPVTTIANSLDLHVYDIQRVEALAGPQGTLYGSSSLSGTLRIITNKPDHTKFLAGYDLKGNKFTKGAGGGEVEGFVNIPINDRLAVRLVGYYTHDGGFINNKLASVTYQRAVDFDAAGGPPPAASIPADPLTVTNTAFAKSNFNDSDTYGGRAALKFDLNDQWSITPSIVYQHQKNNGIYSYDPLVGDLALNDFSKDFHSDHWYQSALTVEGKIGNWDLMYSGGWFERKVETQYDYSGYSIAYDAAQYAVAHMVDNNGNVIDPTQNTIGRDKYTKQTHELRINSPSDNRFRLTAGVFFQRQTDKVRYEYRYDNNGDPLASTNLITNPALNQVEIYSVDGTPGAIYISQQVRVDRDSAIFADGTFDITDRLKFSAGIRGFKAENSLFGFFGFGVYQGAPARSGEGACVTKIRFDDEIPCVNIDRKNKETGETHRANLTFQITPDAMVYGTYSTGFRPGGSNRVPFLKDATGTLRPVPPYESDTLTNYEIGWKTAWFDRRLRVNGAVFFEKWNGLQILVNGPNGIGSIFNAGNAESKGIEGDISWNITDSLNLSASGTYVQAKLTTDFCRYIFVDGAPVTPTVCTGNQQLAPKGTRLPVTPKVKANATLRYRFDVAGLDSFVQGSVLHRSEATTYLRVSDNDAIGNLPGYTSMDFSAGTGKGKWNVQLYVENVFDKRGVLGRNPQCVVGNCLELARVYPTKPRIIGIQFGQRFGL